MSKWLKLAIFFGLGLICTPLVAQEPGSVDGLIAHTTINGIAALGAGLAMNGLGLGIGKIGASACESMARQPDMAGKIQTAMIIAAALIEGAGFFAIIVAMLQG